MNNERKWWLRKWARGGWSIGDPMNCSVKKWAAHTKALTKSGHLETMPGTEPDSQLRRITEFGLAELEAPK